MIVLAVGAICCTLAQEQPCTSSCSQIRLETKDHQKHNITASTHSASDCPKQAKTLSQVSAHKCPHAHAQHSAAHRDV